MVYVQNAKVHKERPWGLRSITDFFWGIILFIVYFLKTLVGSNNNGSSFFGGSSSNGRGNRPGGGGGGGGGGPGGGPHGPRTIGRINTIQDSSMPGGGCGCG